jgi:hypothetical protein
MPIVSGKIPHHFSALEDEGSALLPALAGFVRCGTSSLIVRIIENLDVQWVPRRIIGMSSHEDLDAYFSAGPVFWLHLKIARDGHPLSV